MYKEVNTMNIKTHITAGKDIIGGG